MMKTTFTNVTTMEETAVFQIRTPTPTGMRFAMIANVLRDFVIQLPVSYINFFYPQGCLKMPTGFFVMP